MNDATTLAASGAGNAAVDRSRLLVPLGLLALYVIWGSTYLGIRFALASWPPFLLAGVRFLIAGTLLFGFLRLRGVAPPTWRSGATRRWSVCCCSASAMAWCALPRSA